MTKFPFELEAPGEFEAPDKNSTNSGRLGHVRKIPVGASAFFPGAKLKSFGPAISRMVAIENEKLPPEQHVQYKRASAEKGGVFGVRVWREK